MERYYNPVEDVLKGRVGRSIHASSHAAAVQQLRHGEHLYYAGNRLMFWFVACVDDEKEFDGFHSQYKSGMLVRYQLYALTEEEHMKAQ